MLTLTHLRKAWRSPDSTVRTVVSVPFFNLGPRAQVALRGESGSGKTTFLHLIAGLVRPDAGSIRLDEVELTTLGEARRDRLRAERIGCIYQTFNLLQSHTCLENVLLAMAFGPGRDLDRAKSLLTRVGLQDRLDYHPRQLSNGQQQRVAVARALANRPRLVLADEPTGSLDARHASETLRLLRETCAEEGAALLLVSHDASVLGQFEHITDFHAINHPGTA